MLNTLKLLNIPTTKFANLKTGHLYIRQRSDNEELNSCGLCLFMGKVIQKERYGDKEKSGYLFLNFDSYKIHAEKDNYSVIKEDLQQYAEIQMMKESSWCSYVEYEVVNRYTQLRDNYSTIVGEIENIVFTENEIQILIAFNRDIDLKNMK